MTFENQTNIRFVLEKIENTLKRFTFRVNTRTETLSVLSNFSRKIENWKNNLSLPECNS